MANSGNEKLSIQSELKETESAETSTTKTHEERLRLVREKQNEERQRKIEELKAQALAAQKFRKQKDEERRLRIEELKLKENDKRQQVEERKRAICEAEKDRREYILQKNKDRETRIEDRRKIERGPLYAFGSSTPRMFSSIDLGNISPSILWRRATSTTNVASDGVSLSRRSVERDDLLDIPKKRAVSASGLDRKFDDEPSASVPAVYNVYNSVARRKTDLMPTTPIPRDRSNFGSRSSLGSSTPRTPGRAVSLTRLDQLSQPIRRHGEHIQAVIERERREKAYQELDNSSIRSTRNKMSTSLTNLSSRKFGSPKLTVSHKNRTSIKNISQSNLSSSNEHKDFKETAIRSGEATPSTTSSRPGSSLSTVSNTPSVTFRRSLNVTRKPRPISIAVTGVSVLEGDLTKLNKQQKPPLPKQNSNKKKTLNIMSRSMDVSNKLTDLKNSPRQLLLEKTNEMTQSCFDENTDIVTMQEQLIDIGNHCPNVEELHTYTEINVKSPIENVQDNVEEKVTNNIGSIDADNNEMIASTISKNRITTAEEAKAALAERRRLVREEADKKAEMEKIRLEEERVEKQRQLEENERLKVKEMEKLAEALESERLFKEEELTKQEKLDEAKVEEDLAEKQEREEAERLAKIEAERLRNEINERLKKEEKEREERRKRVEAIMARTRAKNGQDLNSPAATKGSDNSESSQEDSKNSITSKNNVDAVNNVTEEEKNQNIEKMDSNVIDEYSKNENTQENIENIFETLIKSEVANNKLKTNGLKTESFDAVENNKNIDFGVTSVDKFIKTSEHASDSDILITEQIENYNNKGNINNNSSALVTSDSQENCDLSLL